MKKISSSIILGNIFALILGLLGGGIAQYFMDKKIEILSIPNMCAVLAAILVVNYLNRKNYFLKKKITYKDS